MTSNHGSTRRTLAVISVGTVLTPVTVVAVILHIAIAVTVKISQSKSYEQRCAKPTGCQGCANGHGPDGYHGLHRGRGRGGHPS